LRIDKNQYTESILPGMAPLDNFDHPVTLFLNQFVGKSRILDQSIELLSESYLFSGILLVTLLWYRWFRDPRDESRIGLFYGTVLAVLAGMLSRVLQHALPFHTRPLYNQNLKLLFPIGITPGPLSQWNSFPSDHACIYFALATVVYLSNRRLGLFAYLCALITSSTRIYLGIHYPSDVLGGAILGILVVVLGQKIPWPRSFYRVLDWEESSPPTFYAFAFLASYLIGTLFTDLRTIAHL
jgi:undecaprenyl-diphosphatase